MFVTIFGLCAISLFYLPFLSNGYGDGWVAMFTLLSLCYFSDYFFNWDQNAALSSFGFISLAAQTKVDGQLPWILIFPTILLLILFYRKGSGLIYLGALTAILPMAVWAILKSRYHISASSTPMNIDTFSRALDRMQDPNSMRALLLKFILPNHLISLACAMFLIFIYSKIKFSRKKSLFIFYLCLVYMAVCAGISFATIAADADLVWQISMITDRVPLMCFAIVFAAIYSINTEFGELSN
jgi:hypothetical protein